MKKRARGQNAPDGAASYGDDGARGKRVTGAPPADTRPHRVFVESVPPAMVAEVFEVAGADDDLVLSSVPPPPERTHERRSRTWSRPPVPHPPHPSHRSSSAPPVGERDERDTLELPSDELEEDGPAPARGSAAGRRAWFAIGGMLLLLGVAFVMRSCAATGRASAPAERPHAAR